MKVSIIMPVYNSEKYLREAIDSILKQTYENFELIIINDGSTDKSLDIIDKFCSKDNRIILKNIENSGVSNARNIGLNISTGEYIMFVDSDDTVDDNFVCSMVDGVKNNDLAICGYSNMYFNISNDILVQNKINNIDELQKSIIINNEIGGFCCNKIFKSNIIKSNNIKFNSDIFICEDLLFVFEYITKISKFFYVDDALYKYRMRKTSATMKLNYKKNISELNAYEEMLKFNLSSENTILLKYRYLKTYYKLANYFVDVEKTNTKIFNEEKNIIKKATNFKEKIFFYLIKFKIYKYINYFRLRKNNKKLYD